MGHWRIQLSGVKYVLSIHEALGSTLAQIKQTNKKISHQNLGYFNKLKLQNSGVGKEEKGTYLQPLFILTFIFGFLMELFYYRTGELRNQLFPQEIKV